MHLHFELFIYLYSFITISLLLLLEFDGCVAGNKMSIEYKTLVATPMKTDGNLAPPTTQNY
jgi:hypothetical protein